MAALKKVGVNYIGASGIHTFDANGDILGTGYEVRYQIYYAVSSSTASYYVTGIKSQPLLYYVCFYCVTHR